MTWRLTGVYGGEVFDNMGAARHGGDSGSMMTRERFRRWGFGALLGLAGVGGLEGAILERWANETLQVPLQPPAYEFEAVPALGDRHFDRPVGLAFPPGVTNQWFILEKLGRISVVTNLAQPTRTVFLDVAGRTYSEGESGLLGLAFHPGYATNRYFYVYYTPRVQGEVHDRLSRFEADPENSFRALPGSELVLFSQRDEASNHNAGDVHFGPEGYLYVSLGDEGGGNDSYNNSQRIDKDFFSGILRIDVDKRPGSLTPNPHPANTRNYGIPPDNPFVGAETFNQRPVDPEAVHTEFWAVGLRNPWRFSFDPGTGLLYCGDVGQGAWEEIDIIRRGGNYGWAYREGRHRGPKGGLALGEFLDPIHEYGRDLGASITGGVVYRGNRYSGLYGAYVYGDYVSGRIWALRFDGNSVTEVREIARVPQIAAYARDPHNGDILMADLGEYTIKRLVRSEEFSGDPIPEYLSETGAFADLAAMQPEPGILPYELNVPFWSDGAQKYRWFCLPRLDQYFDFAPRGNWALPEGAVWIKHFELELEAGVPESARRIETRFLIRNPSGVYGFTYRWNEAQTDAQLVPEEGATETFSITTENGATRQQVWQYPSRNDCLTCHTRAAGWALGFHTAQLNRSVTHFGGEPVNQLAALAGAGYFATPLEVPLQTLPALAPLDDAASSPEFRVRSWLDANCSQCHHPGGLSQGAFDARIEPPTAEAGLIDGPLNNPQGDDQNRVLRRGDTRHSMLLQRIATRGPGQMPPIASNEIDVQAVNLIASWVTNELVDYQTTTEWQIDQFGSPNAPEAGLALDPDRDLSPNSAEYLTGTNPLDTGDAWRLNFSFQNDERQLRISFRHPANRSVLLETAPSPADSPWQAADIAENIPFFPAEELSPRQFLVPLSDPTTRFYRLQLSPP